MKTPIILLAGLIALGGSARCFADCAANATVGGVKAAYAKGLALEKQGRTQDALQSFVGAQGYTCDPNPVAADAARHAAALARPLADAARAAGDHARAFELYESGGYFAAADRELMTRLVAGPDDIGLYEFAAEHFNNRQLPALQVNYAVRIAATGAYSLDPTLLAKLHALPAAGAARALEAEGTAFNEAFLGKVVEFQRSRPSNPTDFAGMQRWSQDYSAFRQQWPQDPMREAQRALGRLQQWAAHIPGASERESWNARRVQRAEARISALTRKYAGAPELLAAALDFLTHTGTDNNVQQPRADQIKAQASLQGDAALGRKRYLLAIDYYEIAGARDKAQQARNQMQAAAMAAMKPQIEAMQRDADALKAQFSDPNRVAEMRRQAQDAQRALQQGTAAKTSSTARKSKDDLAKELGL